jgi:hypothetical protein
LRGVIITTNDKADGVYLPADDRRHYVAWSDLKKEDFAADYWNRLWAWYENGGYGHVAAYLTELDISDFDPKAPPPKTAAFWDIVDANRAPEDAELADVLDELGNPDVTTLAKVQGKTTGDFDDWIRDRRNRRQIPYRFERCGYVPVRNEVADDGLWVINKKRQVVYGRATLSLRERLKAAQKLTGQTPTSGNPPVSDVGEISDLASPLDSAKTPQFNGESQITDFTASTDGRKSATSAKQLKSKAKTGRGAKAPKPRSDDLLYTGPVVPRSTTTACQWRRRSLPTGASPA